MSEIKMWADRLLDNEVRGATVAMLAEISDLRAALAKAEQDRDWLATQKLGDQDAYVAMRDQRDAAQADAKRLDFMIESRAYVVSNKSYCDGYWLHYAVPRGTTWVQASAYKTPRAAIDTAMQGERP